jgi:predicted amidohydrolase
MSILDRFLYNLNKGNVSLKVACVAMKCDPSPERNLQTIKEFIAKIVTTHPEVELILFGEVILGWYNYPEDNKGYHQRISKSIPGAETNFIAELAKENGIMICFGMTESENGKIYNSQVVIDRTGDILAVHRKNYLRSSAFVPGSTLVTRISIKSIKTGIIICYDIQNYRVSKELKREKLDLILHSLADEKDPKAFGVSYNAKNYNAWIVNANRYGLEGKQFWNGHITISNPMGRICARSENYENYLYYEIAVVKNQSWTTRRLRIIYLKISLAIHVIRNLDIALGFVWDKIKTKRKRKT